MTLEKTEKYGTVYYTEGAFAESATITYASFADGAFSTEGIYGVAHYQGGYDVFLDKDSLSYKIGDKDYTIGVLTGMVASSDSSVTITATYNGKGVVPGMSTAAGSQTIMLVEDSLDISTVTGTVTATTIAADDYSEATTAPFTPSWSGNLVSGGDGSTAIGTLTFRNSKNASDVTDNYWTFSPIDLSSYKANQAVSITISGMIDGKTFTLDPIILDVVAGSSQQPEEDVE